MVLRSFFGDGRQAIDHMRLVSPVDTLLRDHMESCLLKNIDDAIGGYVGIAITGQDLIPFASAKVAVVQKRYTMSGEATAQF